MNIPASIPRFAIVGITATFIHVMLAMFFIQQIHWHPSIANGMAFIAANLFSYAANTRWSFESKMSVKSWRRFLAVSFLAWVLTISISWLVQSQGGHHILGITLVVLLIPPLSYIGHKIYTYK